MRTVRFSVLTFLAVAVPVTHAQNAPRTALQNQIDVSICNILRNPSAYDNRVVRLRALVRVSSEYSTLEDQGCSEGIWFALADGSAPPGLVATVSGKRPLAHAASRARPKQRIPLHLVRDSSYVELMGYLEKSARGESCTGDPPPGFPPDCHTYSITATFVGRIDSVSRAVRTAHLRRDPRVTLDGVGFGHMGIFDVQLVVQSVETVVAKDKDEYPRPKNSPAASAQ